MAPERGTGPVVADPVRTTELKQQSTALVKAIAEGPRPGMDEPERLIRALRRTFGSAAASPVQATPGSWKWRAVCVRDPAQHGTGMTIRDEGEYGMRLSCAHGCLPSLLEDSARELERWTEPPPRLRLVPSRQPLRFYPNDDVVVQLRALSPREYIPALTGVELSAQGRGKCPFHQGNNPHALSIKGRRWTCWNCGRTGSSVIDFASLLWGISPSGPSFVELKDRLARDLLGRVAA